MKSAPGNSTVLPVGAAQQWSAVGSCLREQWVLMHSTVSHARDNGRGLMLIPRRAYSTPRSAPRVAASAPDARWDAHRKQPPGLADCLV